MGVVQAKKYCLHMYTTQMGAVSKGVFNMIKQLIEKASIRAGSQNKLAEKIGLTSGRISEFKNYKTGDKRKPNDETILKIADILGLDKGETLYLSLIHI